MLASGDWTVEICWSVGLILIHFCLDERTIPQNLGSGVLVMSAQLFIVLVHNYLKYWCFPYIQRENKHEEYNSPVQTAVAIQRIERYKHTYIGKYVDRPTLLQLHLAANQPILKQLVENNCNLWLDVSCCMSWSSNHTAIHCNSMGRSYGNNRDVYIVFQTEFSFLTSYWNSMFEIKICELFLVHFYVDQCVCNSINAIFQAKWLIIF